MVNSTIQKWKDWLKKSHKIYECPVKTTQNNIEQKINCYKTNEIKYITVIAYWINH
jgi:hypothetical protein